MRLLLDTHTIVWMMNGNSRLSPAAHAAIKVPANPAFASAASVWEAATKFRLGKFSEAALLVDNPRKILASLELEVIPVSLEHARLAGSLVHPHKDPFDRMLAAQALLEGLTLVSIDPIFDEFAVNRLW
ncbi:MAG TPA: type II toxin-antitoxin system VapC family toxin [Terracidiphilus sp.]|nr:type II toxin-antitoxin system VapC family toxin [Terracidiphilus sp.]